MGDPDDKLYEALAEKWLLGTITPEEEALFNNWYNQDQDNKILIPAAFGKNEAEQKQRLFQNIQSTINQPKTGKKFNLSVWAIAATFTLLAISAGAFIYLQKFYKEPVALTAAAGTNSYALTHKAVLTLADGSKVFLADVEPGASLKQGAVEINKAGAAVLKYNAGPLADSAGLPQLNTLAVPPGAQYQLVLADGSQVWLNAGSSLQFPVSFTGTTRQVKLQGEGYFEVAKSTVPFEVEVNGLKVQVLGTQFNLMAYANESAIKTTLLEGAVRVVAGKAVQLLQPGQQATLSENNELKLVREVDVTEAVAWKNGLFQFNNTSLPAILRQIERRYDVQIEFAGPLPTKKFTGKIPQNTALPEVLDILKYLGFNYQEKGKQVVITQDNL